MAPTSTSAPSPSNCSNYVGRVGDVYFGHDVANLTKQSTDRGAKVTNLAHRREAHHRSQVHVSSVPVAVLHLLKSAGIAEAGLVVPRCRARSCAAPTPTSSSSTPPKVYGRPQWAHRPMSVPHLDTRHQPQAGPAVRPVAGWSPSSPKNGKYTAVPSGEAEQHHPAAVGGRGKEMAL